MGKQGKKAIKVLGLSWWEPRKCWRRMLKGKTYYLKGDNSQQPTKASAQAALVELMERSGQATSQTAHASPTLPPETATATASPIATLDIGSAIEAYVAYERQRQQSGQISLASWGQTRYLSSDFKTFCFRHDYSNISSVELLAYRESLLQRLADSQITVPSLRHFFRNTKALVSWLAENEYLAQLPKNINSVFKFRTPKGKSKGNGNGVKVYSMEEIKALYSVASDRGKLFILLGLNCGMGAKDISDLEQSEYDGQRIIRGRSKTDVQGSWLLWEDTKRLLDQEKEATGKRLLLHVVRGTDGQKAPLLRQTIHSRKIMLLDENNKPTGDYSSEEFVKTANAVLDTFIFNCKSAKMKGNFYRLRATGANWVKDVSDTDTAQLYLAHKTAEGERSQSIADKHYLNKNLAPLDAALLAVEKSLKKAKVFG